MRRSYKDLVAWEKAMELVTEVYRAETQVLIAQDLGYLSKATTEKLLAKAAELGRVLNGLLASLGP